MGRNILVTGATGFIGAVVVDYLKSRGDTVRVLTRPESDPGKASSMKVEILTGRYDDPASLRKALEGMDMVFHLAGVTKSVDEKGFYDGNVLPVKNLLESVMQVNPGLKRFLLVSSLAAAGPADNPDPGSREEDDSKPVSVYGESKLEAEKICLSFRDRLPVTIVRPPAVYGPGDRDVLQFIRMLQKGLVLGAGDVKKQRLSLVHVDDLVRGMVMAAESPAGTGEMYYITSPKGYSWEELSAAAARELGVKRIFSISLPKSLMKMLGYVAGSISSVTGRSGFLNPDKVSEMVQDYWVCSPRKAERQLGFTSAVSLEDGMHTTIAWYREKGWL
ncbi:MAG: NAD-dependent epimerase/dehydratase family protein [Chlorobium sp.]|nr:NAD-dependent epimerase/dehydratase family protein [Chlorobium sp.]MCW8815089.1 NAD-dependent epimerase/dehydratase family protein [Chlorobium sp.]MCW8818780.1 NAD-dependent epimerase/dehydratase family protein [Ignavibacteriaceae bacterium]